MMTKQELIDEVIILKQQLGNARKDKIEAQEVSLQSRVKVNSLKRYIKWMRNMTISILILSILFIGIWIVSFI